MTVSSELRNNVVIITGAGSGIGRAAALRLACSGVQMALVGRTSAKLESVAREIAAAGGSPSIHALNLTDVTSTRTVIDSVLDRLGRIYVLINAAGDTSVHRRLMSTRPDEVRSVIDANLLGAMYCTQAVVQAMLRARQGTIINLASMVGVRPSVHAGMAYSAAKAAVINFTQFLEAEFRNTGIRACAILPGEVDTPFLDKRPHPPDANARTKMITPEDVAEIIALVVRLPQRTTIPYVVIRPTIQRDVRSELESR